MGGICLNWGCIPSKALIAATNLVQKIQTASDMGITVSDVSVDVAKMQAWKDGIVKKLTGGVGSLVKGAGARDRDRCSAKLLSNRSVEVTKAVTARARRLTFDASKGIVVATGTAGHQAPELPARTARS
jgi:dihydrolipoamide dehydrogenase